MIDEQAIIDEFSRRHGERAQLVSAPGRVNLIGEHTDYNDGFVLPFAIDRRTYVACSPRTDGKVSAYTMTLDKEAEFDLAGDLEIKDWTLYIRGMAATLARRGVKIGGANMVIDSDIPFGAGLSSSAALEISLGLAICALASVEIDLKELALAGQEVEHEFAGVRSGIMDQLVSALARPGHALLIDCRSLATEHVPLLLDNMALVVCDSKVEHELASTEYNKRRAECEEGVRLLRTHLPSITALRDVSEVQFAEYESELPDVVRKRCRHVVGENARTLSAVKCLKAGDARGLGEAMYLSHASLKDDYEVSCRELDILVDAAASIDGVLGSRMTGGGFGGCTISLVESEAVDKFNETIHDEYRSRVGKSPAIFIVAASEGARGAS